MLGHLENVSNIFFEPAKRDLPRNNLEFGSRKVQKYKKVSVSFYIHNINRAAI